MLGTPDRAFQEQLAKRAVAEDLSVREVEDAIRSREESEPVAKVARARSSKLRPPGLLELEELLGDYLETRVRISMSPRRGRVEVDFATLEDLERIYRVITEGRRPSDCAETSRRAGLEASSDIGRAFAESLGRGPSTTSRQQGARPDWSGSCPSGGPRG